MKIMCLLWVGFFGINALAYDWELEKDKNGIRVYTRKVSGYDIKEYKAYATINAPRIKIAEILTRVSDFQNWMPNVDDSRVLKVVSSTRRIIYYSSDLPWPTDDRDVVLDFWIDTDDASGTTMINMKENLTEKSKVDGFIRMTRASGFWKLTSISEAKTKVHYQFLADPAGSLPSWLINMFIVDAPYDTIEALKKKVE